MRVVGQLGEWEWWEWLGFGQTASKQNFQRAYSQQHYLNVSSMKNKKQKRRNQDISTFNHFYKPQPSSPLKIKFDLRKDSIACFIGEKKSLRKTHPKGSASLRKTNNNSKPKPPKPQTHQLQNPTDVKPKQTQSQEIVQGSLNSILSQIQTKGMLCGWSEVQEGGGLEQKGENQASEFWRVFSESQSLEKSHASVSYYSDSYNYQGYNYAYSYKNSEEEGSVYLVRPQQILYDPRTTVMIRNIPNKYTIKELSDEIDNHLSNTYDFLYLPCDIKNQCNVGYGFINFITTQYLATFYSLFQGKRWAKFRSQKICNLTYARLQGLDNLIDHFQNSKVLNQKDKKYRPIIREFAKIEHLIKTQQLS